MIKYGISKQITGIVIGKLNKKRTFYIDKEYLTDDEILGLIVILAKHIKKEGNETVITSNGKPEITITHH